MARKPANLIYGVDDTPSPSVVLVLGLQHLVVVCGASVFAVAIVRGIGGTTGQAELLVQVSLLVAGMGTILQALRTGPVGSGYLCPHVCGPSYLPASLLAAQTGGLSLMLGMTVLAGCFEALFARVLPRLRAIFPPEIVGLVVMVVGLSLLPIAVSGFVGITATDPVSEGRELLVAGLTLVVMVGLSVWGQGAWRLYGVLIGLSAGYCAAYVGGVLTALDLQSLRQAPLLAAPSVGTLGWSFDLALLAPFLLTGLASALKSVGDLTVCQKANDAEWKRPNMGSISRGLLAEAIGTITAGLLGGVGQSTSSTNIAVSLASGATSRRIAFAAGSLLMGCAFLPKVATVFALMPTPVMGALLIFTASFMIIAGLQLISSRMLDSRKTFVVGISLLFGLSVNVLPQAYAQVPAQLTPLFSSPLSVTLVVAIGLNLLFRIGTAVRRSFAFVPGVDSPDKVTAFMESCGAAWGARQDVVYRGGTLLNEFFEGVANAGLAQGTVTVEVSFDEFNLDMDLWYEGTLMEFSAARPPTPDEILSDDTAVARLSAFLISRSADRVTSELHAGRCHVRFHLEH